MLAPEMATLFLVIKKRIRFVSAVPFVNISREMVSMLRIQCTSQENRIEKSSLLMHTKLVSKISWTCEILTVHQMVRNTHNLHC